MSNLKRKDNFLGGVDLNRNYGYKFGYDNVNGSVDDPCDEIYRGKSAFSEYETQGIKKLVEISEISSAMNFHSFGNLWVTPYNYYNGDDYESLMKPEIYKFYRGFENEIKNMGFLNYGNGYETVKYPANGEASDWMLGVHNIISFSPELGIHNDDGGFYPGKQNIPEIIDFDYKVIDLFFSKHYPTQDNFLFGYSTEIKKNAHFLKNKIFEKKKIFLYEISFLNKGITDIFNLVLVFKYFDENIVDHIKNIYVIFKSKENKVKYEIDKITKVIKIENTVAIPKLEKFEMFFEMKRKIPFEFEMRFFSNDNELIKYSNYNENAFYDFFDSLKKLNLTYVIGIFWFVCFFILILFLLVHCYQIQKETSKKEISEIINSSKFDLTERNN